MEGAVGPGASHERVWRGYAYALVLILWLAAFAAARLLEHAPHASLWFPPAAVTFAALLLGGPRMLVALLPACAVATFAIDWAYGTRRDTLDLLTSSLAFAAIHTTAFGLPAARLRRSGNSLEGGPTIATVMEFLLWTAAGAAAAASGGVLLLAVTGQLLEASAVEVAVAWWLGDYIAIVTLAPLVAIVLRRVGGAAFAGGPAWVDVSTVSPPPRAPLPKLATFAVATVGVLGVAHAFRDEEILLALLVLPLVLQLWITYTEPRRYTVASVTLFSLATVGAASLSGAGATLVLQCAALSLAANAWLGLAVPALVADNSRLREQLARDRLTGAMSRTCYQDRAAAAVRHASATGGTISLVLLDIDGLKEINDRHGHLAGDALLVAAVERCRSVLGDEDSIARLGGDEFVVLMPGRDEAQARELVARMQLALALATTNDGTALSASFGIAAWTPGETPDRMLARADDAMYIHKRSARSSRIPPTLERGS